MNKSNIKKFNQNSNISELNIEKVCGFSLFGVVFN